MATRECARTAREGPGARSARPGAGRAILNWASIHAMRLHPRLAPLAFALCFLAPNASIAQILVPGFTDSIVAQTLDLPSSFDFLPDGRVVVVEQWTGKIRLIVNGQMSTTDPVMTVPVLTFGGERGLLGIAVDPQFPARPYLYTHQTSVGNVIRISRWTVTGDLAGTAGGALAADPASRYDLIANIPDNASNHNGGTVRFGPDGMLYVSLGEDADNCSAQSINLLKGKILRLRTNLLPPGAGQAFRAQVTPPDNPYVASADSNARLVYAYGLRNPFRVQVDAGRNCLVIGDVGLDTYEEIDLLALPGGSGVDIAPAGSNFGWPWREANMAYMGCGGSEPASVAPIYAYDRSALAGASLICGGAYRAQVGGTNFPNRYEGDIFFSEYYTGNVYRLEWNGSAWVIAAPESGQANAGVWASDFEAVADWRVGPDGALWACRQYWNGFRNAGRIERIVYTSNTGVPPGVTRPGLRLSSYPSPARGTVTLSYGAENAASVTLRLYDVRGRLLRELPASAPTPQGAAASVEWDGLDAEGRKVPNGVYYARLESGPKSTSCRVVLAR